MIGKEKVTRLIYGATLPVLDATLNKTLMESGIESMRIETQTEYHREITYITHDASICIKSKDHYCMLTLLMDEPYAAINVYADKLVDILKPPKGQEIIDNGRGLKELFKHD